jgi:hypothetical protein
MAKGFVRSMLQLLIWPLFRPSRWRTAMAALDLAPGFALADLSMRRADHRRLAARVWFLWLCVAGFDAIFGVYPLSIAMGVVTDLEMAVLAFLSILAIGASASGAITLLLLWQVVIPVLSLYIFNVYGMAALPMEPLLVVLILTAFGFGGLRYGRNASVVRHLITLLAAPFLMTAALLPIPALAGAWQLGLNFAVWRGEIKAGAGDFPAITIHQYNTLEVMLLEICFGFPMIVALLLLLPMMRDLTTRVWTRTRTRRGGLGSP